MQSSDPIPDPKIYTISQLTQNIKFLLEEHFSLVWITGEISNFRVPASGHFYFTLKDDSAQINSVMFKGQNRNLKFTPEDGMKITGFGRISVFEPRGTYQIILEYLEPSGIGALQAAFEQLKIKLAAEGLFDSEKKKPIPFLPETICLITSPTGAVVHDMIRVIQRRYLAVDIEILPVKVQGEGAEHEISSAIELLNQRQKADIAILARGGGSLEDLSAFNSEKVARSIFASSIPIISAVGHETDFTIADFVADLRAPTPSVAAELAVPVQSELVYRIQTFYKRICSRFRLNVNQHVSNLEKLSKRLVHPQKKLDDAKLRLDDYYIRLIKEFTRTIKSRREKLSWLKQRLDSKSPFHLIENNKKSLQQQIVLLESLFTSFVNQLSLKYKELYGRLHALSPTAVLKRGYSITRLISDKTVVTDSTSVCIDQPVEVMLARGILFCRVERKHPNGQDDV
ncbi:MAG: exodeoxyribonuclease VII large subunit [Desulfobacterales bacterium]|jgi:exodeoxyribonuclease VII large subunit|nr:exodeoxyribonuclease VII large subunit [Desulfobacterales bacterium]